MDAIGKRYIYVTLLSSDDFCMGTILLQKCLKKVKSQYPLLVLCSQDVSSHSLQKLQHTGLQYRCLKESIVIDRTKINRKAEYEHWNRTFDKLFTWTLTDYDKIVFVDSDMQVVRNIDHLFSAPHLSAVRADIWNEPDIRKLNSGLMVIKPSMEEFHGMCQLLQSGDMPQENMGDQDVIRQYYSDWGDHEELFLPYGMNVFYSGVSLGEIKEEDVTPVSIIHYIGERKPWMISFKSILRRMRGNFLKWHLLRYVLMLYATQPSLFWQRYTPSKNA